MPVYFVNIPDALKHNASFCVRKLEKRSGRPTKVPYNPKTGAMAMPINTICRIPCIACSN